MKLIYNKKTGRVKMVGKNKYDKKIFGEVEKTLTPEQKKKIGKWNTYYRNNDIEFEETCVIKKEEEEKELEALAKKIEDTPGQYPKKEDVIKLINIIK